MFRIGERYFREAYIPKLNLSSEYPTSGERGIYALIEVLPSRTEKQKFSGKQGLLSIAYIERASTTLNAYDLGDGGSFMHDLQ